MNNPDEYWRSQCAQQMRLQDDGLRDALYGALVEPHLTRLSGGNQPEWGEPGWYRYSAGAAASAPPDAAASAPFPVPLACSNWYGLERDADSERAYRFFQRRAWLQLAYRPGARSLTFTVPHAALPEAVQALQLSLFGRPHAHCLLPCAGTLGRVLLNLDDDTLAVAARLGRLELELACQIALIPAFAFAGATDMRSLSLALTEPELLD